MRTLTSVALAGALAASAVAATATGASAGGWHHGPYPPTHNYYYGPDAGAVAAGAIIGLAFGALASQAFAPAPYYYYPYPPAPPPVYPSYAYGNPHTAWCAEQYSTYNPETDTWMDFQGVVHVCFGPY